MDTEDIEIEPRKEDERNLCEISSGCVFFLNKTPDNLDYEDLINNYCINNNLHCARYMVFQVLGLDKVPPDLYPQDKTRAYEVIAADEAT